MSMADPHRGNGDDWLTGLVAHGSNNSGKPNIILDALLKYTRNKVERTQQKARLEEEFNRVKLKIKEARKRQFKRVYREFYSKEKGRQSYEKKFNVTFDTMLLALFGEKRFRKFQ